MNAAVGGAAQATQQSILRLTGVSKFYQRGDVTVTALSDVTFSLAAGEMVALVGPSGCGKSTTLNVASGVDRPERGTAVVCGIDIRAAL